MMSKSLDKLAFILFVITAFGVHTYAQKSDPENVLAIEKQRFLAMLNKDTVFLHQVLADDLLYCHSNGNVDTKQTFIRAIAERTLDYKVMDLQETNTRSYRNTVIINGKMHVVVYSKNDSKQADFTIRYLDVYHKEGKNWKLVAWQATRLQ